jgi:hypothetical protein
MRSAHELHAYDPDVDLSAHDALPLVRARSLICVEVDNQWSGVLEVSYIEAMTTL